MEGRFNDPRPQFHDANGNPLAGGKLYFYQAGTSTPKDTYSDRDFETANPNPAVLNAAGRPSADIWLDSVYKVKLTDADDAEIWTADYVSSLSDLNGAFITAEQFGAVGDGETDDAAAILELLQTASANKATAVLRSGKTYRLASLCWLRDYDNWTLIAHGATILIPDIEGPSGFNRAFKIVDCDNWRILGGKWISQRGTDKTTLTNCMSIENSSDVELAGCHFEGATAYGLVVAQDTEYRQAFDFAAGSLTTSVTVTSFTIADYSDHMVLGLRENTQTFTDANVSAANDTITITNHGGISGQVVYISQGSGATLPGGLSDGRYYYVTRVDADTVKLSENVTDYNAGTFVDITSAGSGTNDFLLRRRTLTAGTDYTVSGQDITLTPGYQNKRLFVDVAKACNDWHVHNCTFKDCQIYGYTHFPKKKSINYRAETLYAENCGTADDAFPAFKIGQACENGQIRGLMTYGGKNGVTIANWYSLDIRNIQCINFERSGISIPIGDHGGYDPEEPSSGDESSIFNTASHRLLEVSDVQLIWTPDFADGQTSEYACRINGTKDNAGQVFLRDFTSRGVARTVGVTPQMPIPGVSLERFKSVDPSLRHIDVNNSAGALPAGLKIIEPYFWTSDLTAPSIAPSVTSPGLYWKGGLLRGVGQGANAIICASGGDGSVFDGITFEDCCPTSAGTVAAVQTQDSDTSAIYTIRELIVRGASSKLSHLSRATAGALINDEGGHTARIPSIFSTASLATVANVRPWHLPNAGEGWFSGTAAPTTETWRQGDTVWNREPAAGEPAGWICISSGTPGTWAPFGTVVASTSVSLTADDQVVTVGFNRWIRLSSNTATAADRTFVLTQGQYAGQELVLEWTDTNAGELADDGAVDGGGNVRLSATWTPTQYDILRLIWNGTDWIETTRSAN